MLRVYHLRRWCHLVLLAALLWLSPLRLREGAGFPPLAARGAVMDWIQAFGFQSLAVFHFAILDRRDGEGGEAVGSEVEEGVKKI